MDEPNSPAGNNTPPNADDRISQLEQRLAQTEQRYSASSEEGKRLAQQNQVLMQELQGRMVQQRNPDPFSELDTLGVPQQALREAMRSVATEVFGQALEPVTRAYQARPKLMASYPDYNKFEAEVAQFVQNDPELSQSYQRMFQADPVGAMELAYLKYGDHQRRNHPQANGNRNEEEKVHAQIPNARSAESRAPRQEDDAVKAGWEHYQKTGRPEQFAMARFRQAREARLRAAAQQTMG
jgi:hypothetical protein